MTEKIYINCIFCNKNFVAYIPKDGDGTGFRIRKHFVSIPHTNNLGITILPPEKKTCLGSYRTYDEFGNLV